MALVNNSFPYFNITSRTSIPSLKDFSKPLHVDCSVEYELPNSAKPPVGTKNEPLLMIHPSYYRREESQNRSPFINNLPQRLTNYMSTVSGGGQSGTSSRQQRSQMRALSAAYATKSQQHQQQQQQQQMSTCSTKPPSSSRPPLICSSNEAVNCNTDRGIFKRSPMTTNSDLTTLHSDIQNVPDARFLTVMKDNKSFITDLLPSVCQEVNNNSTVSAAVAAAAAATKVLSGVAAATTLSNAATATIPGRGNGGIKQTQLQQRSMAMTNPQPAVGVAAVAASAAPCTGCNPCLEGDPCGGYVLSAASQHPPGHHHRHRIQQQQPWSGMTAPQFASFPTTGGGGGKYRKNTLDSPAVASATSASTMVAAAQKRGTPWTTTPNQADSGNGTSAKRSKLTSAVVAAATAAAVVSGDKTSVAHSAAASNLYTASAAAANFSQWCNNILPNYTTTATPSTPDCCKVCQQQQWNYTSHCRAASANTASSIIWNNENMLRLFQV